MNSGLLPVTPWAGQEAELFLGIAGGTSTNAQLSVQNIRFIGLPRPILEPLQIAGGLVLTWAESVPGLVLEFSQDLTATNWLPMANTAIYSGQRLFTNEVSLAQGFYRLRVP